MRKTTLLLGLLAAPFLLNPVTASADPPPWAGQGHKKHKEKDKYEYEREYEGDERVIVITQPRERVIVVEPPRERVIVVEQPPRERVIVQPAPEPVIVAPPPRQVASQPDVGISRGTCNRDTVGALLGGVIGGVVGSQVGIQTGNREATTAIGAVMGILVGKSIGSKMDDADRTCTAQVFENAKNGQTVSWNNPDSGMQYQMTPVNTFDGPNGPCRTYNSVVTSGGQRESGQKLACRAADGTWNVTNASR